MTTTPATRCYWISGETDANGKFRPALVRRDESGYLLLPNGWSTDMEQARTMAADLNAARFGITPDQAADVVLSSMQARPIEHADASVHTLDEAMAHTLDGVQRLVLQEIDAHGGTLSAYELAERSPQVAAAIGMVNLVAVLNSLQVHGLTRHVYDHPGTAAGVFAHSITEDGRALLAATLQNN